MDLATVADELYALTPDEFTATRNERAKEIRADGDRDLADAVKKLPKAATAAWAVNVLVRHQADQVEQVLELGAALRQAQENLDGDQLRELDRQRRQLIHAVTRQARALAADLGQKVSETVAGQVEETLHAAMTDEEAAKAVRSGLLVEPLAATGLGSVDLTGAVAVPSAIGMKARPATRRSSAAGKGTGAEEPDEGGRPELTVVPDDTRELDDAREELERAEEAATKAERKRAKAGKRVDRLEARSLQLQSELEELRRRVSEAEHALEGADDELADAEERHEAAEESLRAAQAELDAARKRVAELERRRR